MLRSFFNPSTWIVTACAILHWLKWQNFNGLHLEFKKAFQTITLFLKPRSNKEFAKN